jgi:hypothetical protein
MLSLYIYLILQLLIVVLIYCGFDISKKYSPPKIKVLSNIVFSLLLTREISLLILFFWENIMYLYLLKPFVFINLICFPLTAVICLYIFLRNDRINFSYSFIILGILLFFYIVLIIIMPHGVQISEQYGYYISLLDPLPAAYFYIAFNSIVMIICILGIGKPMTNNAGLYIIALIALASIAEMLLSLIGIELLVHSIIGDICWVSVLNYALLRLKK